MYSFICNNFFHCDGEVLYVDLRPKILLLFFFSWKMWKTLLLPRWMLQLMIHPHSTKYKGESMCRDNTIYFIFTFDTFLLESQKLFTLLEFFIAVLRDWLKKLVPLCHPIRRKIKTNRDALVHIFPRVTSATRLLGFEFWFVDWIACVLCDWLDWKLCYYL